MKWQWALAVVAAAAFTATPVFAQPAPSGATSPTRGKIVYTSKMDGQADIYTIDAFGKNIFNLTHDKTIGARADVEPVWSPTGQFVVFERQYAMVGTTDPMKMAGADLMIVDAQGTNLHALTPSLTGGTWSCHPSWSKGDVVFFTSNRDGNFDLYAVNADGTGLRQLTKTQAPVQNLAPAVSPDGTTVVFTRSGGGPLGMTGLYLLNLKTGVVSGLTWTFQGHSDFDPAWSPDGTRIAFASDRMGSNDIWMVSAVPTAGNGTTLVRLTSSKYSEVHPAFSPDGGRLALVSNRTGATEIYTLDLRSTALTPPLTQVTFDGAFKANPSWTAFSGLPMAAQ